MEESGVIAYRQRGRGEFGRRVPYAQSNLQCRTSRGHFDPLYPPHLRGLHRVQGIKKENNFLLTTGLELV